MPKTGHPGLEADALTTSDGRAKGVRPLIRSTPTTYLPLPLFDCNIFSSALLVPLWAEGGEQNALVISNLRKTSLESL